MHGYGDCLTVRNKKGKDRPWRWHRRSWFHLQLCPWEGENIKRQRHQWIFPWHPKGQQMMTHGWHAETLTKTDAHTLYRGQGHAETLTRPGVSSWAGPVSSTESGGWDGRSADDKPSPSPRESRPPIGRTEIETYTDYQLSYREEKKKQSGGSTGGIQHDGISGKKTAGCRCKHSLGVNRQFVSVLSWKGISHIILWK